MSNSQIEILNDVTKTLIDSHKGYQTCIETADDNYALQSNFASRATERSQLISEFQSEVKSMGGEPETDGSLSGAAHRGWTKFTSLFQDDEKAAVSALDDGEEFLADKIESCMNDNDLLPRTHQLLSKAHASARAGERFADIIEDRLSA